MNINIPRPEKKEQNELTKMALGVLAIAIVCGTVLGIVYIIFH